MTSKYCLANPRAEYLMLLPKGERMASLSLAAGKYRVTWFDTDPGAELGRESFSRGENERILESPFDGDTLLPLRLTN